MRSTVRSVFETNSSSVHSLVYKNRNLSPPDLPVNTETGNVVGYFGKFDSEVATYYSQEDKLSYILTNLYYINRYNEDIEDMWIFHELEEGIREHCGFGLEVGGGIPYIDHQSVPEDYDECVLFPLTKNNMIGFIFDDTVGLKTEYD